MHTTQTVAWTHEFMKNRKMKKNVEKRYKDNKYLKNGDVIRNQFKETTKGQIIMVISRENHSKIQKICVI